MIYQKDIKDRNEVVDLIQSSQYEFPYHYLPSPSGFPNFSKNWLFSPSYIAGINLFVEWLNNINKRQSSHLHMDYGCGDGGFTYHVSKIIKFDNIDFFGIDFDQNAIAWAKQFLKSENFIFDDVANLPPSTYDSGSLIEVYEHIPPQECPDFLLKVSNSLKRGAPFFVTVPSSVNKVSDKHYRHFNFETLNTEFSKYFIIDDIFGFERHNVFSKLILRLFYTRWLSLETKATNQFLIKILQAKYKSINKCGRIGVALRKK